MRTIINFNELYDAIGDIAAEHKENYYHAEVRKSSYGLEVSGIKTEGIVLKGYIHGFGWVEGFTVDEVARKLRAMKSPVKSELEVELETV
jgi:hypothetical protein